MKETIEHELLLRYLTGQCDPKEENEVRNWLSLSEENRKLLDKLARIWETPSNEMPEPDLEKAWAAVSQKAGLTGMKQTGEVLDNAPPVRRAAAGWFSGRGIRAGSLIQIAAAVAVLVLLPYYGSRILPGLLPDYSAADFKELQAGKGKMETVVLADGSRVTLEAGSRFRYPEEFSGKVRGVELEGEAYFEVAPDKKHPFEVRAAGTLVRVLGTRFDVQAWPEGQNVQVAVLEGAVSFSRDRLWRDGKVVVRGGQLSHLDSRGEISQPVMADIAAQLGWLERRASFEGAPLGEVLSCLERWYGVSFVLSDSARLDERLTMQIENQPLDNMLELLALLTELHCELRADTVYLSDGPADTH